MISKVIWHDAIGLEDPRYTMVIHATKSAGQACDKDSLPKMITPDWLSGVEAVDFGLLHLTAELARLLVRWTKYEWTQWTYATIFSIDGDEIGHLRMN